MTCELTALISFVIGIVLGALFDWLMTFSSRKERECYLNIRRDIDEHALVGEDDEQK